MPRKYVLKGVRQMDWTNLEAAFNHRVQSGCSMKVAADMFGVKKTTLVVSLQIIHFILLSVCFRINLFMTVFRLGNLYKISS